jgi:hypothetical protein
MQFLWTDDALIVKLGENRLRFYNGEIKNGHMELTCGYSEVVTGNALEIQVKLSSLLKHEDEVQTDYRMI